MINRKVLESISILLFGLVVSLPATASLDAAVNRITALQESPAGVVFEIVSDDRNKLHEAVPKIQKAVQTLRQRFPHLDIAVVSHGHEQFSLMRNKQQSNRSVHQRIQSLLKDDVPVHVCGTFAEMYDLQPEDFPDYVDVAPHGPAEIKNYQRMGYILVPVH